MTDFLDLQNRQRHHDRHYHADIDVLPIKDALTHFGEHLTKYSGRLWDAVSKGTYNDVEPRILVDSFIILMGMACRLSIALVARAQQSDGLEHLTFPVAYSIINGRRATASEKLDHLEAYKFRDELVSATCCLAARVLVECHRNKMDIELEVEKRWYGMESKSFLPIPRTPLYKYKIPETVS